MSLQYPPFSESHEFDCLDPELTAVKWKLKHNELSNLKSAYLTKREQLIQKIDSEIGNAIEDVKQAMLRQYEPIEHSTKMEMTESLLRQYAELKAHPLKLIGHEHRKMQIVDQLCRMFGRAAIDEFIMTATDIAGQTPTNPAVMAELETVNKAISDIDKKLANLTSVKSLERCFRDASIPLTFRDATISASYDAAQMAMFVIECFIGSWKRRAVQFEIPVSVYGYRIDSMPPVRREVWGEAYLSLGFDSLKKQAIYFPLNSTEFTPAADAEKNAGIGMFAVKASN